MLAQEAITNFLHQLHALRNASPHTIRNYGADLRQFLDFWHQRQPDPPIDAITPDLAAAFVAHLYNQGMARRTIARRLCALRSFFEFCRRSHYIQIDPMEGLSNPKLGRSLPAPLTQAQVLQLLEQPDLTTHQGVRDRAILELFYSSGLRVSELVALNTSDIDTPQRLLRIMGKGRRERLVPITSTAIQWLTALLSHSQRPANTTIVFLNRLGTRLTTRSVARLLQHYLLTSGLAGRWTGEWT
jgi:integrase/recombinase XerC